MQRTPRFVLRSLSIWLLLAIGTANGEDRIRFGRDIRPILSETCFHCHGPDEQGRQADLRLDTLAGATADLGGYQPIKPHDLAASEAWQRIISDDEDRVMPPPQSHMVLTDEQKAQLRRWIEEGAVYEGHWAFESPRRPPIPQLGDWGRNAIDAFVYAPMQAMDLQPASEADPRTLIRRLTFDLIGLPPTEAEVETFVEQYTTHGETAWQNAITRLFASRHFGERMALPWLDQARYADTNGYSIDGGRDMWMWRDWVIEAYNRNLPFDQFLIHQIAGDLLPNATDRQRMATGFNRNHMVTHEGGTIPEENLANYAADRVKTTAEVFLGLTMGCAQCHDHKYDPLSQRDYYRFLAFFNELSDRGLDGNAGQNPAPHFKTRTPLPQEEIAAVTAALHDAESTLQSSREGWHEWLEKTRQAEASRGTDFQLHDVEVLDVSSPNRPGPFEIQPDGSILSTRPSGGLNGFSHAIRLPSEQSIRGVRIRFFPYAGNPKKPTESRLTPHPPGVPQVTTVLISAGEQPAKQVDIYRQKSFAQATARSHADGFSAEHVLDERNLNWWKPNDPAVEQHLTLTFDEPVNASETPYLSVLVFYGVGGSMPYHWKIEAFTGTDPDTSLSAAVSTAIQIPEADWTPTQRDGIEDAFRRRSPSLQRLRDRITNLRERLNVLSQSHSTMVMDTAAKPRKTFVLSRGQYDARLEEVWPGTPAALPPLPEKPLQLPPPPLPPLTPWLFAQPLPPIAQPPRYDRLDLARWMVQADHPLTSRVAVNRLWSLFFGNGLVASSADFGSQGDWPSHPELLDYLATELVASGWDQQALIRQIVSSATYRQDASVSADARQRDPGNRYLARGPRFRLPAEFIRDAALSVSGLLVPRIGGPSVHPYQPPGLWKEVSHFGSTPATKQVFVQDRGEDLYRRSLYTFVKRTSPHPAMSAFDAPNREMCIIQRSITNTPMQALVTLNDPQFAEAARVLAANVLQETTAGDDSQRLRTAFARVTSRTPTDRELKMLSTFLASEIARFEQDQESAIKLTQVGDAELATTLDPVTHAAWTQVAALLLNLSETLTRN